MPPPGPVTVLVPLRDPGSGKRRLAAALSAEQRAALVTAMLADVVRALGESPVDAVVVVAGGPGAVAAADSLGLPSVADPPAAGSLDAALSEASARLALTGTSLVVAADLPSIGPQDIAALLAVPTPVAVAPTVDGGTGALLRSPPDLFPTAYGPGSAARHVRAARAAGAPATVVDRPGFRHDVDTAADVLALSISDVGPATAACLEWLGPLLRRAC